MGRHVKRLIAMAVLLGGRMLKSRGKEGWFEERKRLWSHDCHAHLEVAMLPLGILSKDKVAPYFVKPNLMLCSRRTRQNCLIILKDKVMMSFKIKSSRNCHVFSHRAKVYLQIWLRLETGDYLLRPIIKGILDGDRGRDGKRDKKTRAGFTICFQKQEM